MEKTKITDPQEIVAAAQNHTIRELQAMSGLSYHRIWTLLARHGVVAKKKEPVGLTLTKEALEAVYAQGPLTLEDAAKALNTYPSMVSAALRRHGMIKGERKQSTRNKFTADRAFRVLSHIIKNPGDNLAEIGRKFDCSREYVRQVKECATINGIL